MSMLKLGIRTLRTATRTALKTTEAVATALGVEEQVEKFQKGVESLPLVKPVTDLAVGAADFVAPEHQPLYKQEAGPHDVGTHRETFVDESRGREVPLTVYYPEESAEKSPVVVVSPGLGGNGATYRYLGKHLASHGYTVLQPTHEGSDTKAVLTNPLKSYNQGELADRKADLSFSLDLLSEGQLPDEVSENADLEQVALAGHSFGALTAQAMAGVVTRDGEGQELDLKDERFDAFIAMSPFGDSAPTKLLGMDPQTYDQIDQPIMYISGDKDRALVLGKGVQAHRVPYEQTASKDKYFLEVGGAHHLDFGQVFGLADRNTADMTKSTSLAFLDAHLKGEEPAQAYLADDLPGIARSRDSMASVPNG